MNRERLALLAARLESVPERHFNLESWIETRGYSLEKAITQPADCGTTACAGGWACTIPEFKEQGLGFCKDSSFAPSFAPSFGGCNGGEALMRFFGIDNDQMNDLFNPIYYPRTDRSDPKTVCNRIYKMLAD